jgi:hypothetical protein
MAMDGTEDAFVGSRERFESAVSLLSGLRQARGRMRCCFVTVCRFVLA